MRLVDISARTEYAVRAMLILAEAATTAAGPVSVAWRPALTIAGR